MLREDGLKHCPEMRHGMACDAPSHLSPHLHFGTVSVGDLARTARDANAGKQSKTWGDDWAWREFYASVLWHFPHAATESFCSAFPDMEWEAGGIR